ncbi:MAG: biotin--[Clostridia bacterium]|nr:biotin--[acetyl-CoA-carboxylase] ligase [Clostridia bacterium]
MTTKERVFELIKIEDGRAISGENIAKALGISRAAVWKAINALRKDGYSISAVTNKGYSLSGDYILKSEIEAHLNDKNAFSITVLKKVDSTNTYLKNAAEKGEIDGSVIIAETQTAGKGRLGRHFYSEKGGLYMSILVRPNMPTERSLFITTGTAVAVSRAIEKICEKNVGIKWVNDIFLNGKKVCGILAEGASDFETGRLQYAVVGIGINVTEPKGKFNKEIADIATAIYDKDEPYGIKNRLAAEILNQFSEIMNAPDDKTVIDEYRARSIIIGKEVNIIENGELKTVTVADIDDTAAIILKTDDGNIIKKTSGEISIKVK